MTHTVNVTVTENAPETSIGHQGFAVSKVYVSLSVSKTTDSICSLLSFILHSCGWYAMHRQEHSIAVYKRYTRPLRRNNGKHAVKL